MKTNEEKTKTFSETTTEIFHYYDPAKLGSFGLPEDEYASEAEMIIYKLRDVENIKSLQWAVYDVFVNFFSKDIILTRRDEHYRYIAEEIWDVWQEAIQLQK